jgi:hypothetical protein
MTANEIVVTLKANVGRTVRVTYIGGETEVLFVHSVDDEGFVTDPISPDEKISPPDVQGWWVRFEAIAEVKAVEPDSSIMSPQPE